MMLQADTLTRKLVLREVGCYRAHVLIANECAPTLQPTTFHLRFTLAAQDRPWSHVWGYKYLHVQVHFSFTSHCLIHVIHLAVVAVPDCG